MSPGFLVAEAAPECAGRLSQMQPERSALPAPPSLFPKAAALPSGHRDARNGLNQPTAD